jgi:polysaccharide export outer membrane protein
MPLQRIISPLILAGLLAACVPHQDRGGPTSITATPAVLPAPDAFQSQPSYRLGPWDVIDIHVFRMTDFDETTSLDGNGNIRLPLVGEVSAADHTTAQLAHDIEARLGAAYLEHPQVSVTVRDAVSNKVVVDGSVVQPGAYPIEGRVSLSAAIALARGEDKLADMHSVAIFRTIGGERKVARFDIGRIRRGDYSDPDVYRGDVIVVGTSGLKSAIQVVAAAAPLFTFASILATR